MARSKSSGRWLRERAGDAYVKQAAREGYRSRAVYKLEEIQRRDRILRPGLVVVDLGAAPGGWSQYAARIVQPGGRVIAVDLLCVAPVTGVEVLQGDITHEQVMARLLQLTGNRGVGLVLADLAPNMTGMSAVDQPRAMHLAEVALEAAERVLKPGGDLLVKVFQGQGFTEFVAQVKGQFSKVTIRKPKASRDRSREVYVLARNYEV